jgi:Protein of unknown function (DUF3568)
MRWFKTLLTVTAMVMMCSCASTVDPGEEGSGIYSWQHRELRGNFAGSLLDVAAAAERAFVDLRLVAVDQTVDGLKGKVTASLADGTSVRIKLKAMDFETTKFNVKVGAFGDKAMSQQVTRYIARELAEGE